DVGRALHRDRQVNGERRAPARLAVERDATAALLDDAVDDRQSQARALPRPLRREERLADARLALARDAVTGVAPRQRHPFAARPRIAAATPRGQPAARGRES